MTDIRKVRPVAPLDAEHYFSGERYAYWVVMPVPGAQGHSATLGAWCPTFSDDVFAAAFMPAELFDAVLNAAREIAAHWLEGKGEYVYPTRGDIDALVQAVRAHDAARTKEGL